MNAVDIRRMKIEDADEIGAISTAITQRPVGVDFKRIIEEQLRQEKNACFVAEIEGKVVGFMISYIQSGGFGLKESAWVVQLGVDPNIWGRESETVWQGKSSNTARRQASRIFTLLFVGIQRISSRFLRLSVSIGATLSILEKNYRNFRF